MFFTLANHNFYTNNKMQSLPASKVSHSDTRPRSSVGTISDVSCLKGSLTLEASLTLPFFILIMLSVIYFINLISLQTTLQIRLEECARKLNSISCVSETQPLSVLFIRSLFFTKELETFCDNACIRNGHNGISFFYTQTDSETGICDIRITYHAFIPFIPGNIIQLPLAQRCRFKLFTGNQSGQVLTDAPQTVYITSHGSVYHINKYCSYLIKYTDIITLDALPAYEQQTSRHFTLCNACKRLQPPKSNPAIYISSTGSTYHYSKDCYYLTSDIFKYNYEDIKDIYPACSRCSQSIEKKIQGE